MSSQPSPTQDTQTHCPTCRASVEEIPALDLQDVLDVVLDLHDLVELIAVRLDVPDQCLRGASSTSPR